MFKNVLKKLSSKKSVKSIKIKKHEGEFITAVKKRELQNIELL
jgi:hypothetical protein